MPSTTGFASSESNRSAGFERSTSISGCQPAMAGNSWPMSKVNLFPGSISSPSCCIIPNFGPSLFVKRRFRDSWSPFACLFSATTCAMSFEMSIIRESPYFRTMRKAPSFCCTVSWRLPSSSCTSGYLARMSSLMLCSRRATSARRPSWPRGARPSGLSARRFFAARPESSSLSSRPRTVSCRDDILRSPPPSGKYRTVR
mmetsp:Transcript_35658/g.101642  ORF Transcript_35658/g.101642 Transcript_35658/m.101642 type:complete len:200 (+) Transcript_35658:438-1037(+)